MKRGSFICISAVLLVFFVIQNVYALECVTYVKQQKPGGYNWSIKYPVKDSKGNPTSKTESWIAARDLWTRLWVTKRGSDPKKDSVFVMDTGSYGHVGIVTKVNSSKKITVKHANWDPPYGGVVATGTYTRSNSSTNMWKYTTSSGKTWSGSYKIYGFVYKP
jgi:hypothetical protein